MKGGSDDKVTSCMRAAWVRSVDASIGKTNSNAEASGSLDRSGRLADFPQDDLIIEDQQ